MYEHVRQTAILPRAASKPAAGSGLLIFAGLLRLFAAVFSGGFLASDDHHVVIGAADQIAAAIGLPPTTHVRPSSPASSPES